MSILGCSPAKDAARAVGCVSEIVRCYACWMPTPSTALPLITAAEVRAALATFTAEEPRAWLDAFDSPVGALIAAATNEAVCLLTFVDRGRLEQRLDSLRRQFGGTATFGSNALLRSLGLQLEEYFAGTRRTFDLPLDYSGTSFQRKVWSLLLEIPFGQTWSYLQLAERTGDPGATRAVGMANGANPIAIVIPCHRVINAGGELGGYGGGLWRKRILLDLETGQTQLAL